MAKYKVGDLVTLRLKNQDNGRNRYINLKTYTSKIERIWADDPLKEAYYTLEDLKGYAIPESLLEKTTEIKINETEIINLVQFELFK